MNNSAKIEFIPVGLKIMGGILIVSSTLYFVGLAISFQPNDASWLKAFTSEIVNLGIVPLIGLILILIAYRLESVLNNQKRSRLRTRKIVSLLSVFLGILYLTVVPLAQNVVLVDNSDVFASIEPVTDVKTKLRTKYQQFNDIERQVREAQARLENQKQSSQIVSNPQSFQRLEARLRELDAAIAEPQLLSQQLTEEQIATLSDTRVRLEKLIQLANNPPAWEQHIQKLEIQLRSARLVNEHRAKLELVKHGIWTGINSLMLAIAYLTIGSIGRDLGLTRINSKNKRLIARSFGSLTGK